MMMKTPRGLIPTNHRHVEVVMHSMRNYWTVRKNLMIENWRNLRMKMNLMSMMRRMNLKMSSKMTID